MYNTSGSVAVVEPGSGEDPTGGGGMEEAKLRLAEMAVDGQGKESKFFMKERP